MAKISYKKFKGTCISDVYVDSLLEPFRTNKDGIYTTIEQFLIFKL